jgi:acetyltransferase
LGDEAIRQGREWLDEAQSKQLLAAYGIPTVRTRIVRDASEAVAAAEEIGFPVALKILSPQILHKTDVGGVALALASAAAVQEAAARMLENVARLRPEARILGFTVQQMAELSGARELIVGVSTDAVFGPVLLFGSGGTDVELRKEHAVALPPLNTSLARDLVARSGLAPLLAGHRGRPPCNEEALLATLRKVSRMVCDLEWLAELDINPLLIDEHGVLALDARVRVRPVAAKEAPRLAIQPYPSALEEYVQLDGQTVFLRPIRPEDGERLKAFYANASVSDMRLRFFMARREVPHSELARYSQIDYDREMTFIALVPQEGGRQAMVAEVRAVCDPDNRSAEFAIQVATAWQGKGLGRLIMDKLIRYLRERGTGEIVGQCLMDNAGMAALARNAGFTLTHDLAQDVMLMRLPLSPAA